MKLNCDLFSRCQLQKTKFQVKKNVVFSNAKDASHSCSAQNFNKEENRLFDENLFYLQGFQSNLQDQSLQNT